MGNDYGGVGWGRPSSLGLGGRPTCTGGRTCGSRVPTAPPTADDISQPLPSLIFRSPQENLKVITPYVTCKVSNGRNLVVTVLSINH